MRLEVTNNDAPYGTEVTRGPTWDEVEAAIRGLLGPHPSRTVALVVDPAPPSAEAEKERHGLHLEHRALALGKAGGTIDAAGESRLAAIRLRLDEIEAGMVERQLMADGEGGIFIIGADEAHGWRNYRDPSKDEGETVPLVAGGQWGEYPASACADLDTTLRIFRAYHETGSLDPSSEWDNPPTTARRP